MRHGIATAFLPEPPRDDDGVLPEPPRDDDGVLPEPPRDDDGVPAGAASR